MRMISKIMRSMRDTGLLDGMSDEDCDTLATAALEAMREPDIAMIGAGGNMRIYPSLYMGGPPEQAKKDAVRIYKSMVMTAIGQ